MPNRVVVTGVGVVSALGMGVEANRRALFAGESGVAPVERLQTQHEELPVGEVKYTNAQLSQSARPTEPSAWSRTSLLALAALREAASSAHWDRSMGVDTGLISATTVGGMDRTEWFYPEFLSDNSAGHLREVVHHDCGASTELLAEALGVGGFLSTINTACSSSVNAIMLGTRLIQAGRLKRVFVGGTDGLSRFTLNGFNALMILSDEHCRPFDAQRKGLNLGEGAAFLMLERASDAEGRGVQPMAEVSGFANANDAFHQTASSPEGKGAQLAMRGALKMARLDPTEIDVINAHGTATPNNDLTEARAIQAVFGEGFPSVSSTKGFTGHTLGAAGSVESVFSILSIQDQVVFPNLGWSDPMPELSFRPVTRLTEKPIRYLLSNSFGFGGNCSSVIFSRP